MADDLLRDLGHLGTLLRATSAPIGVDELRVEDRSTAGSVDEVPVVAEPSELPRRPRALLAVAAVLVAAVVGGLVVVTRRPDPSGGGDQATTSSATTAAASVDTAPTSAAPDTTAVTTPVDPLLQYRGWWFPASIPDGFQLTRLVATTATSTEPVPQRWVRRNANGTLAATLALSVSAPTSGGGVGPETVHGQPANAYDSGEGMVVAWQEGGRQYAVRGFDLDVAATLALADALELTADGATLPASTGFQPLALADAATDAVSVEAEWTHPSEPLRPAMFRVAPNTDGETLELLLQRSRLVMQGTATIQSLGDEQVLAAVYNGGASEVAWFRDGLFFDLTASLPLSDVLAMAASVNAIDPHDLQRRGEQIGAAAAALDTFDDVTLADGLHLMVKANAGATVAFCVDGAVAPRCHWQTGTPGFLLALDLGARRLVVGWTRLRGDLTPLAARVDGTRTPSPAPLVDQAATERGRFFAFELGTGDPVTMVKVGDSVLGGLASTRPGDLFAY